MSSVLSYPGCLFGEKISKKASSVNCSKCKKLEHRLCVGLELGKRQIENYLCFVCSFEENQANWMIFIARLQEQATQAENELKNREALVKAARSETTREFRKLSERVGVKLGAYHGKMLPGNHVKNFLRNHQLFFEILENLSDDVDFRKELDGLKLLTGAINKIHHLCCARFLEEKEIVVIEEAGEEIKQIFEKFKFRVGTLKLHSLIYEMPKFARKYRTIGILGEQGVESEHVQFGNAFDRYKYMKPIGKRIEKSMKKTNERNIALLKIKCAQLEDFVMPKLGASSS